MELLTALWKQLRGEPVPEPWETDPDILAARERQHDLGITDYVAQRQMELDFWRRHLKQKQENRHA